MFDKTSGLSVTIDKKTEGVFVVKAKGRIDSDTHTILEKQVNPILLSSTRLIVFDMEDVDYISSAGLSIIFHIQKIIGINKGSLFLASMQPQIKKVFDIIKSIPSENIFKDIKEADAYIDRIQKEELRKRGA